MTFEVAHQGSTHAVLDDGVVICWLSDDVEPELADRIARALNAVTARTASCFLHGAYDATLTRCPRCATDALTRRAEKAEAECGRLQEQLDAARQALERIAALDPSEWHHGSGWKAVEFIQRVARAALGVEGEQE